MTDIKTLETDLKELSDVIELAKTLKIMEEADKYSAQEICDKYIKENNLEYIKKEIEQAFRFGFFTYSSQKEKIEQNTEGVKNGKNSTL